MENEIEKIFMRSRSKEKFDEVAANIKEVADLAQSEYEDGSVFRTFFLDEMVQVKDSLSRIADTSFNMLEYLDLIETNTRPVAVPAEEENQVTTNEDDPLLEQVTRLSDLMEELLDNSDYEIDQMKKDDDVKNISLPVMKDKAPEGPKKGLLDSVGDFMGGFGGIAGALKKGAKILGKGALVAGTVTFLKDLYDTFNDEERLREISGNIKDPLTGAQQSTAAIAGAIESFTLGLIDAKEAYGVMYGSVEFIQKVLLDAGNGLFEVFQRFELAWYDAKVFVENAISKITETFQQEGLFAAIGETFNQAVDGVAGAFENVGSIIRDTITGFLDTLSGYIKELFNFDIDLGGIASKLGNRVTDSVLSLADPDGFGGGVVSGAADLIGGFFGDKVDAPTELRTTNRTGRLTPVKAQAEPINRVLQSDSMKLSKERFDQAMSKPAPVAAPIVNTNNNVSNVSIVSDNGLSKQIQLLGI